MRNYLEITVKENKGVEIPKGISRPRRAFHTSTHRSTRRAMPSGQCKRKAQEPVGSADERERAQLAAVDARERKPTSDATTALYVAYHRVLSGTYGGSSNLAQYVSLATSECKLSKQGRQRLLTLLKTRSAAAGGLRTPGELRAPGMGSMQLGNVGSTSGSTQVGIVGSTSDQERARGW